jgi:pimeloyl-ACP methyl ester carboxylesterase
MTGVTRLARTSILILLLTGVLSPVPVFASGPPWYFYNQCTSGGRYDYQIHVSGTIVPSNGIWWVSTVDTIDGDKVYGSTPAGAPGPCGYPKFQGTNASHPDDLQGLMQGVPDGNYVVADNNSISSDGYDPSSGYGNPAYYFFHIKNGLVYMDGEPNGTTTVTTPPPPPPVHNAVVWASTSAQPNELRIYTPNYPNPWFGGTAMNPSVKLGVWDKPDFTATASTTVHIWSRWNGSSANILDVTLRTSKGGDPFYGTGYATTTAEFITPYNDSYYRLGVTATSTLQEYVIPTRIGETIHQGDEVWVLLVPSYASYGADHWVGSNGAMPYMEICEGPCDASTTPPAPTGPSSVLFLPGIESSRLYRPDYNGGTDKLWEPNIDADVQDLYLGSGGTGGRSDIYTKEKDVIDTDPTGKDIYKPFLNKMDGLKSAGTIADWEPIAYDWRLSLDEILSSGHDINGRIYYTGDLAGTTTPYIIQELRRLASTSKSGKVTIVAHSNGGLVAKRLTEILGPTEASKLIDRIILVAVPQVGTPMAIVAGMHGYDQEHGGGLIESKNSARTFAKTSPMFYNLLPSQGYFTQVDNSVIYFDYALPEWISHYGGVVHSQERLDTFVTDTYQKTDAQTGDINQPTQLDASLLTQANALHAHLDTWAPPAGVDLIQIAGWGVPSLSGITYKQSKPGSVNTVVPEMVTTIDGDGTVVTPSALWTSASVAKNYWFNLKNYNSNHLVVTRFGIDPFDHSRILATTAANDFIADIVASTNKPLADYQYLSTSKPSTDRTSLRYALHSPLTLNLYDVYGNHTGISTTTGEIEEQVPGTYYMELGDVKYIFSDASSSAHVQMSGYATSTFTFSVDQLQGDTLLATTTFKDIPVTPKTQVNLDVVSDITTLSPMSVDLGNGTLYSLVPKANDVVTIPKPKLTIVPTSKTITLGSAIPALTATLTGFQTGDTASSTVTGLASCTTTATATSGVGNYPITCTKGTLVSGKYDLATSTPGTLTITYRFDGFLQPINDTAHQVGQTQSVFKGGSTVPAKLQLKKADGTIIQGAVAPIWLAPQKGSTMSASVDESIFTDQGTTGSAFSWDSAARQYSYNWSTKGLVAGYWYKISVKLDDGTTQTVSIGLK